MHAIGYLPLPWYTKKMTNDRKTMNKAKGKWETQILNVGLVITNYDVDADDNDNIDDDDLSKAGK